MRSLIPVKRSRRQIDSVTVPDLPISAVAVDPVSNATLVTLGPTEDRPSIELKRVRDGFVEDVVSWDAPSPLPDLATDQVLSLRYLSDLATSCVVLRGGDIILIRDEPMEAEDKIEIVGSVDAGILSAEWSPDEEVLALVTGASTFLLMTKTFESIAEVSLTQEDITNSSNHVSVGWGKSETQFRGKRAKASLRDPTLPDKIDEGVLSHKDDGRIWISWRGDGSYVAINTIEEGPRRAIRVYTREGSLDSVSIAVDGMEGVLSWKPTGQVIASTQRSDTGVDVIFFERNGLRHGEFSLRMAEGDDDVVQQLKWNTDSSILAVCFSSKVQLWTTNNFYWYLKQEISCPNGYTAVDWHQEKPTVLFVAASGVLEVHVFTFAVLAGNTSPPYDFGATAVVDGKNLKLTPLRVANVPPPMAFREVELQSTPTHVSFGYSSTDIAVLRNASVDIIEWPLTINQYSLPQIIGSVDLASHYADTQPRQIVLLGERAIAVISDQANQSVIKIFQITPSFEAEQTWETITDQQVLLAGSSEDGTTLYYELQDNTVHKIGNAVTEERSSECLVKLPGRCARFEVVKTADHAVVFALSENGKLFANDRLLSSSCTSFVATPTHLVFSTVQHTLKFVLLGQAAVDLAVPADDAPAWDERLRSIERGSRIVQVMPSTVALVLQHQRGNLETVYPRALVLAGVRDNIDRKDYHSAFMACRTHRIDMNILYDYAPAQFLENVKLFVSQLGKSEHLDLVLSGLSEEDVTQTLYRLTDVTSGALPAGQSKPAEGKVTAICDAVLAVLATDFADTHVKSMLTCHLSKVIPDREAALLLVKDLKDKNSSLLDEAVEHITFLADVNKLYNDALGLYDLGLTLLIAQQSQKDPREYMPFLQSLHALTEVRRKFVIDDHLSRFAKALVHLNELGDDTFDEVSDYVVKHALYTTALDILKYHRTKYDVILRKYAEHLLHIKKPDQAGLAFEMVRDERSAMDAYRQAGMWKEALSLAVVLGEQPAAIKNLAEAMIHLLVEKRRYLEAATVYVEYMQKVDEAAKILCKGYAYAEAIRLVTSHDQLDLLESLIRPAMIEGFVQLSELLADCKRQLNAQLPRLRELRIKKKEDPQAFFEGIQEEDIPDNMSVAATDVSTNLSLFTRYSTKTGTTAKTGKTGNTTASTRAKHKRREERKRARGKKGSVYEEEYLVNSIRRLIDRVNDARNDATSLVVGLARFNLREQAGEVQRLVVALIEELRNCLDEVFSEPLLVVSSDPEKDQLELADITAPVVAAFEQLSVLQLGV
ncbi:Putative elongator complex protein 1 [Saitoella coloradoensis]